MTKIIPFDPSIVIGDIVRASHRDLYGFAGVTLHCMAYSGTGRLLDRGDGILECRLPSGDWLKFRRKA